MTLVEIKALFLALQLSVAGLGDPINTTEQAQAVIDAQLATAELQNYIPPDVLPVQGYDIQMLSRPVDIVPTLSSAYAQSASVVYAGALGVEYNTGGTGVQIDSVDAASGAPVQFGVLGGRTDFYLDGARVHTSGRIYSRTPLNWERGEGTLVIVYDHIDGEGTPLNQHPDLFTFNGGSSAALFADRYYLYQTLNSETTRQVRMGGKTEGVTQLTWDNIPNTWDENVHIEIVSWSQTDSYLMIDGVDYGTKGGMSNAGVDVPTVDSVYAALATTGTPRIKFVYSIIDKGFMPRSKALSLSTNLFEWAE